MLFPAGWIAPQWPVPAHVRAVCTTRSGGVSLPPYGTLNLGDHVGDAAEAVAENRRLFRAAISARPVFLRQVHGLDTAQLGVETPDDVQADGCVTAAPLVACTIMVADCLPVLFASDNGRAVAAAHAGWRGLAGQGGRNILECVWSRFREVAALRLPGEALAWLGPCIGPEAFEVGPEVKAAFEAKQPGSASLFRPRGSGKWLADLPGLARLSLSGMGITRIYGNDSGPQWCTASNPSHFFSHRRDGVSGRLAAAIWLA
jgi:polyphenol oxidase